MSDCLFCKILNGEIPNYTIYETNKVLAFLDINPSGMLSGHTIIIPKKHFPNNIDEVENEYVEAVFGALKTLLPIVKNVAGTDSAHIINNSGKYAGQTIDHFHMHIIPRKQDDDVKYNESRRPAKDGELEEISSKIKNALEK